MMVVGVVQRRSELSDDGQSFLMDSRKIGKFEAIIIFSIPKLTIRDQLAHFVDNPFNS